MVLSPLRYPLNFGSRFQRNLKYSLMPRISNSTSARNHKNPSSPIHYSFLLRNRIRPHKIPAFFFRIGGTCFRRRHFGFQLSFPANIYSIPRIPEPCLGTKLHIHYYLNANRCFRNRMRSQLNILHNRNFVSKNNRFSVEFYRFAWSLVLDAAIATSKRLSGARPGRVG